MAELKKNIFDLQSISKYEKLQNDLLNSKLINFENENLLLKNQLKDKNIMETSFKKLVENSEVVKKELDHVTFVNEGLNQLLAKESENFQEKTKIFLSGLEKEKIMKAEAEYQFNGIDKKN